MSFGAWWNRSSGGAKTVVGLSVLLLLQLTMCGFEGKTLELFVLLVGRRTIPILLYFCRGSSCSSRPWHFPLLLGFG